MNIDFAPTFIDLAGGTPLLGMDGQSLKPLLLSQTDTGNASTLSENKCFI